jgi:hypothetical protein
MSSHMMLEPIRYSSSLLQLQPSLVDLSGRLERLGRWAQAQRWWARKSSSKCLGVARTLKCVAEKKMSNPPMYYMHAYGLWNARGSRVRFFPFGSGLQFTTWWSHAREYTWYACIMAHLPYNGLIRTLDLKALLSLQVTYLLPNLFKNGIHH